MIARKQTKVKEQLMPMRQVAKSFRSRTFLSEKEAEDFVHFAKNNRLKDVRTWAIPDNPVKYKVIWFETDTEVKSDAEEKE